MGNTVTTTKGITIAYDGSPGDFDIATYFPGEVLLAAVKLKGTTNDAVIVRHGSATGQILSEIKDTTGQGIKDTFVPPVWCKPYIYATECTLSNGTEVMLELA